MGAEEVLVSLAEVDVPVVEGSPAAPVGAGVGVGVVPPLVGPVGPVGPVCPDEVVVDDELGADVVAGLLVSVAVAAGGEAGWVGCVLSTVALV